MNYTKIRNSLGCVLVSILLYSCESGTPETESEIPSTIDSNTVAGGDSIPAILHLDNADDTTYPVALDSLGPTVDAADTSSKK